MFTFPHVVDERAARLVAGGVIVLAVAYAATGWLPLVAALAYGFVARVASGPRFCPLALLVTRVVVPRLPGPARLTAGPPKRFAQAIGAAFTVTALVLHLAGASGAGRVLAALLVVPASLEAFGNFCVGCWLFGYCSVRFSSR